MNRSGMYEKKMKKEKRWKRREREANGKYKDLKDFMGRLTSKEINKRTIENLIQIRSIGQFW